MHPHKQIDVRDIFGVHVEATQLTVRLAEEFDKLHVVQYPGTMDRAWLEAPIVPLRDKSAGVEVLHWGIGLPKIGSSIVLDYTNKLK